MTSCLPMKRVVSSLLTTLPLLSLLSASGVAGQDLSAPNAATITLRAGVVQAAPFALHNDTTGEFSGFQPDLLLYLQDLAAQDGYNLEVELELAPQNYGGALDLVANDCNTTAYTGDNPQSAADCEKYDIIIADYYVNADRSMRVDFSPAFLQSSMATIKVRGDGGADDYSTLSQLEAAGGVVCLPEGTLIETTVAEKFPGAQVNQCAGGATACIAELKAGNCALFVEDELQLRYRAIQDAALQLPGETFNTQYIVWALRQDLPVVTATLLRKWMFQTVADTTMDELYYKYFAVKLCPLGKAGPECDEFCDPKHGESDRFGKCQCHSTKYTGEDCSIETMEDFNLIPSALGITGYVMFAVNMFLCASCALWLYWKREESKVKATQPMFLYLVLLGCVISSTAIITLEQESPGVGPVPACVATPWLYSVGFSITFGTLFAKILRVYRLFKGAENFQQVKITALSAVLNICAILSVDVIICLIWTLADPMHWTRDVTAVDKFGSPLESQGYCTSDHWAAFAFTIAGWHLALMILALGLCYVSRDISSKFSEAKPLAVVMVSQFQIFLISVPVLIIVGADGASSFFVRAAVIWLNDFSAVGILFGNLIYSVHSPDAPAAEEEDNVSRWTSAPVPSSIPKESIALTGVESTDKS